MPNDAPYFDESGRLISPKYGDVYFSAEDGLAETQHVFLKGNALPERFGKMKPGACFTIGETGFGTGLNFLVAWQHFERYAPADARLEFVSVEGFPLKAEQVDRSLAPWPGLERYRAALLEQWGPIWPGFHRFRFAEGRVRLALLVGEAADVLSTLDANIDAWFLDGFAPSRNPGMWSEEIFEQAARLSAPDATLATYTAAGFVRRGLEAVGFEIEKQPGFGTKRDMTVGRYIPSVNQRPSCSQAAVIGGSLAGAFAARSLAERGVLVTLLERQRLIDGELETLRPRVAVLQPKINDIADPAGRWLREGYGFFERWLHADRGLAQRCGWDRCGSFQTRPADRSGQSRKQIQRAKRFNEQFAGTGLCRWVEAEATEAEVGLPLPHGGLLVERAGLLRPAGLCAALLDHPSIILQEGVEVESIEEAEMACSLRLSGGGVYHTSAVVIANAYDASLLAPAANLRLKPVRGQVTLLDEVKQSGELAGLKRALFFGGYLLPAYQGKQTLGASFVPGETAIDWRHEEHVVACEKLCFLLREDRVMRVAQRLKEAEGLQGWAGVRTTTPHHRCYAEPIGLNSYASLGHGSHGIASAAHAGEHLASLITGGPRLQDSSR